MFYFTKANIYIAKFILSSVTFEITKKCTHHSAQNAEVCQDLPCNYALQTSISGLSLNISSAAIMHNLFGHVVISFKFITEE